MSAAQIARLKLIGEQMAVELITADLFDNETLDALKNIVIPIAEALKIETVPRATGPLILDALIRQDPESKGWYGFCGACGIATVMWDDYLIAKTSLTRHMEHSHADFEYSLRDEEKVS